MFIHLAIHRQYPDMTDELAATMSSFGDSMVNQDGFQQSFVLRDQNTGWLMGLALWDSKEQWLVARPAMAAAVAGVDFSQLEPEDPDVFHLDVLHQKLPS